MLVTEYVKGDVLELRIEKPHVVEKKKGARSNKTAAVAPAATMRILHNDQEVIFL